MLGLILLFQGDENNRSWADLRKVGVRRNPKRNNWSEGNGSFKTPERGKGKVIEKRQRDIGVVDL